MAKKKKKKNKGGGGPPGNLTAPPWMSYDPALSAERRGAQRDLGDLITDLRLERRYGRKDFQTSKKDLRTDRRRGLGELVRGRRRGEEDIGFRREDVRLQRTRGREDFGTRLNALTRRYNVQGQQQMQTANAAGVSGGGTNAAGLAKRTQNMALDRAKLDTGLRRLEEDTGTSLGRLAIDSQRLRSDTRRGKKFLKQDFRHDLGLARRDWSRARKDITLRGQRGRREAAIADTDLLAQMVYNARQNNPGSFTKFGGKS